MTFVVEIEKTITVRKFARVASAKDATDAATLIAGRSDAHDTTIVTARGEWEIMKVGKGVVRDVYERRTDGYTQGGDKNDE